MTRLIDLPALGAPVDTTRLAGANTGAGTLTSKQLRDYVLSGQMIYGGNVGVKADGVTDDTAAVNTALATGRTVILPQGSVRTTGPIQLRKYGQELRGEGRAAALADGTRFGSRILSQHDGNIIEVGYTTGTQQGNAIRDLYITAPGRTGGFAVSAYGTLNLTVKDVIFNDIVGGVYLRKASMSLLSNIWGNGAGGTAWVHWDGTVDRSDVLTLSDFRVGEPTSTSRPMSARPYGIIWDGNAHSLIVRNSAFVGVRRGLQVQNSVPTVTATPARFLMASDIEIDYVYEEAMHFEAGGIHSLNNIYCNAGSLSSGDTIWIGPSAYNIAISGGQNYAWQQRAIYCAGTDCTFSNLWSGGGSQAGLNAFPAIYFDNGAKRCQVIGGGAGQFTGAVGNNSYGVQTHAGAQNIMVTGCAMDGKLGRYLDGSNNLTVVSGYGSTNTAVVDLGGQTLMEFDKSSQRWLFRTANAARLGMYADRIESFLPHRVPPLNKANLPAPTANLRGAMAYVLDATGGEIPAFCDGAAWRRMDDRTVVA